MHGGVVSAIELTDDEWQAEREAAAKRFYGMTADEFAVKFSAGDISDDLGGLSSVLAFFPELD
jgi:hypothetical protein